MVTQLSKNIGSFPGGKMTSVKLITHIHLVLGWRMRRAIPPLSHML